jgi:hypothetical protein
MNPPHIPLDELIREAEEAHIEKVTVVCKGEELLERARTIAQRSEERVCQMVGTTHEGMNSDDGGQD